MSKTIAILVIVGGAFAAYLVLRPKTLTAPSSTPTITPPVAPGHTTT